MGPQNIRAAGPLSFTDALAASAPASVMPIPDLLRGLDAVVIALITEDGALKDANRGFLRLMTRSTARPDTADVRDLFVNPRFGDLATRPTDRFDGSLYRGLLSFGTAGGKTTSLRGSIYGQERDYLLVAEHDVVRLDSLQTSLLELQESLSEKQRQVAHLEQRIARLQELADAALRDRDTLLDALAHRGVRPSD